MQPNEVEKPAVPFISIHHPKKRRFLLAYSHLGLVTRAARAAGIDRTTHRVWKRDDPEYAKAFEEAREMSNDAIEDAIVQRAVHGIDRPVFHQGKICGYVREYADTLLMFTAKANMPEKYRERATVALTDKDGNNIFPQAAFEQWIEGGENTDKV